MLAHRLLLGPLLILGLLLALWIDGLLGAVPLGEAGRWFGLAEIPPGGVMAALFALLVAGSARELARLIGPRGMPVLPAVAATGALLGLGLMYLLPTTLSPGRTLAVAASAGGFVFLMGAACRAWQVRGGDRAPGAGAGALVALVYLGLLPGLYLLLRREQDVWVIAAAILTVKSTDIGAYFTGRAAGRHKMIPWLSPGKSWEGLAGGLATAGLAGIAFAVAAQHWLPEAALPPGRAALAGILIGGAGQLGDLVASAIKRDAGAKDSGTLPGFGGLLDLFDSPLLAAPVAYWLLCNAGGGVPSS